MVTTTVVNLRKEKYDVYIGRPGKGQDGFFGNPIVVGEVCVVCDQIHTEPGDTVPCFRKVFEWRLMGDPEFVRRLPELKDKILGCFCKPNPCHGDVYVEYFYSLKGQS